MKKKNMLILGIGAALAAAATVFFIRKKKSFSTDEKPPKKAPQVPIENPGDQSEFTTSATESEIG